MEELLDLKQQAIEGTKNPLELLAEAKKIEKILEDVMFTIKPLAVEEIEKHGGSAKINGVSFAKTAGGRYVYNTDTEWGKINKQLKDREVKLIAATKAYENGDVYVTDDGEQILPVEFKSNAPSVSVKL